MKCQRLLGITVALVGAFGCIDPKPSSSESATKSGPETESEETTPPPSEKEQGSLHAHMQEHFVRVDEMRLAIVEGKLDEAKALAKWLASHPPHTDLPKGWEPFVEMMRVQSREVLEEQSLAEAALDTARVAGTCGSCHVANRAKVDLGAAPKPEDHEPLEHHMWAAERLWDAVVSQSDDLWTMGVSCLDEAAVLPADMKNPPPELVKAKATFSNLQEAARKADSPNARVEVLGTYLGQCVGCHSEAKRAPNAF